MQATSETEKIIKYYQAILETTTEGFVLLDLSGQIILSNKPADDLLNLIGGVEVNTLDTYAALESIGFFTQRMIKQLVMMRKGQIPESVRELITVDKETETLYIERFESPILSGEDEPLGWMIGLRDVTVEQERALWQYDMTNMIVHDLKNPIATMLMTLQWIQSSMNTEDGQMLVGNGITVGKHMLEMVDSILDMAKMEVNRLVIEPEAIEIDRFIDQILADAHPLFVQKDLRVTFHRSDPGKEMWGDRIIMRRLLINLLDNAVKFSEEKERVIIQTRWEPGDKIYSNWVVIEVADQGPGIPDDQKEAIFKRFIQLKDSTQRRKGNGLGLAFCSMGVEAHGGQISVKDNPDGGSIFVIRLPGLPHTFVKELERMGLWELTDNSI